MCPCKKSSIETNDDKRKSKDYLVHSIKDSKDRLNVIVEEYCSLIEDKQIRLFNDKNYAATTNQNLIADAAAYTTPELQHDKQAYKRHRLAEEALWLWSVVFCMRQMWERCKKYLINELGYAPAPDKHMSPEEERVIGKYREATWDGVVEGVAYSLDHIRKDIVAHFTDDKTRDTKFNAGQIGSLKYYVLNMAKKRTINKYKTIFSDNVNLSSPETKIDEDDDLDWIETLSDPRTKTPMDRDDKEFLEIFQDGYKQLEKGVDIQNKELKYADSIDWLADYIEKNKKSFEMVIRNIMRRESCESIGKRFGVSKDTVRRRIKDFLKDMGDLIC